MTARESDTVVGAFGDLGQAQNAAARLRQAGFPESAIGIVSRTRPEHAGEHASPVESDASVGAAIGGVGGLVLTFATLAVPGVGPVMAAGPILGALGGAGVGAVAGGLIGAFTRLGIPKGDAQHYSEKVGRGDVLLTVRTSVEDADRARAILQAQDEAKDKPQERRLHRREWIGHNAGAEPLSEDEIRREHRDYGSDADPAYEWSNMDEKERKHTTPHSPEYLWPHKEAHDIGQSLVEAEAENASTDTARTEQQAKHTLGKKPKDLETEVGAPGNYRNAGEDRREKDRK